MAKCYQYFPPWNDSYLFVAEETRTEVFDAVRAHLDEIFPDMSPFMWFLHSDYEARIVNSYACEHDRCDVDFRNPDSIDTLIAWMQAQLEVLTVSRKITFGLTSKMSWASTSIHDSCSYQ